MSVASTDKASVAEPERGRQRNSVVSATLSRLDDIEAQSQFEGEAADRGMGALHHIRSRTRSRPNAEVISWEANDPENPYNWTNPKKTLVMILTSVLIINSTMGSALPSMAIPAIVEEFNVTSETQRVLPISVYLIGYVFGPLIWGPLSEHIGRRNLSISTFIGFILGTLACALAPNWPSLLVFRLICGVCGSAPIAVVAGILADVYGDPKSRGRAFAIFMVTTVFGPLLAPIVSGYCSITIGWRWTFWIALIYAGFSFIAVIFLPETFGPILLQRRAERIRKEDPSSHAVAPRELEETNLSQLLTVVLTRPLRMLASELIVSSTCAYLALVYSIFYMSFQAFPIIFQDVYGLSLGQTGLCYLPIGAGACLSMPIFWYWDNVLERARERDEAWVKREEYRRLPLAFIGGPCFVVSLFWLGFAAKPSITFVAPMLAGVLFGMGFMLIFMAMLNYLTDAYEVYAASANAAASTCRSLFAVILPLATTSMFRSLGISGACALLGGLSAGMCVIPFVFVWKGPAIRARSRFCIALKERKEQLDRTAEEERQRLERAAQREKGEEG